jgi:hypothetical protein
LCPDELLALEKWRDEEVQEGRALPSAMSVFRRGEDFPSISAGLGAVGDFLDYAELRPARSPVLLLGTELPQQD